MRPEISEYNYQASPFFMDGDAKPMKKHGGVEHQMSGRMIADKTVKYILFISAILSIVIVLAIAFFIFQESLQAWAEIGLSDILFKAVWRPGQDQYGILAMIRYFLRRNCTQKCPIGLTTSCTAAGRNPFRRLRSFWYGCSRSADPAS